MGQAKTRTANLLAQQPTCTYCGGTSPSINRDHCPPTAIFDNAHRPPGLEFGACSECHEGTREMDAVVAMLSRNWPAPTDEAGKLEGEKHAHHFVKNFPHLAALLEFNDEPVEYMGKEAYAASIPRDGPLATLLIAFAARVGLALYRQQFGTPAPANSLVFSAWYPNAHLDEDEVIENLLKALGPSRTIAQGKWQVHDQFRYWSGAPVDAPDHFGCFAAFRQSFGTMAQVRPEGSTTMHLDHALRPGFLKGFRA